MERRESIFGTSAETRALTPFSSLARNAVTPNQCVQPCAPVRAFYLANAGGGGPVNLVSLGGNAAAFSKPTSSTKRKGINNDNGNHFPRSSGWRSLGESLEERTGKPT